MKPILNPSPLMKASQATQAELRRLLRENRTKDSAHKKTTPNIHNQENRPTMMTTAHRVEHAQGSHLSKMKILAFLNQYLINNPEFKQVIDAPINTKSYPTVPAYQMKKIKQKLVMHQYAAGAKLALERLEAKPQDTLPTGPRTSLN